MSRVGVVTTSYPREEGDPAGCFVEGFTRWLAGSGARVEVVAAGPGAERVGGIAITRVDGRGLFYQGGAPDALAAGGVAAWGRAAAFQAALAARVAQRMARGRWDAVVSHWVAPSSVAVECARAVVASVAGPGAASGTQSRSAGQVLGGGDGGSRGLRHLAIAHSSDVWLLQRSIPGRALLRAISRRADLVYAGEHLAEVGARCGAPGRVVAMGVDVASLRGERARGRARFGLRGVTALFLGRLVPVKGLERLLAELPDGLDLVIAGDGPLRAALERAAPPRVRFVGVVQTEARADLLAACDLLVLPSLRLPDGRQEGTPVVLREALAAGLPVLATRVGGAAQLLGDRAVVVEPEPGALASALLRFLRDPVGWPRPAPSDAESHDWAQIGPILASSLLSGGARAVDRDALVGA